jgi:hypothetical protein
MTLRGCMNEQEARAGSRKEQQGVQNSKKFSFHEIRCYLPIQDDTFFEYYRIIKKQLK